MLVSILCIIPIVCHGRSHFTTATRVIIIWSSLSKSIMEISETVEKLKPILCCWVHCNLGHSWSPGRWNFLNIIIGKKYWKITCILQLGHITYIEGIHIGVNYLLIAGTNAIYLAQMTFDHFADRVLWFKHIYWIEQQA